MNPFYYVAVNLTDLRRICYLRCLSFALGLIYLLPYSILLVMVPGFLCVFFLSIFVSFPCRYFAFDYFARFKLKSVDVNFKNRARSSLFFDEISSEFRAKQDIGRNNNKYLERMARKIRKRRIKGESVNSIFKIYYENSLFGRRIHMRNMNWLCLTEMQRTNIGVAVTYEYVYFTYRANIVLFVACIVRLRLGWRNKYIINNI